jgi:hypothetical protein
LGFFGKFVETQCHASLAVWVRFVKAENSHFTGDNRENRGKKETGKLGLFRKKHFSWGAVARRKTAGFNRELTLMNTNKKHKYL